MKLPSIGIWLEPAAGNGAIIKAVNEKVEVAWTALEIRKRCHPALEKLGVSVFPGDALKALDILDPKVFDVVITNPPYRLAREFVETFLKFDATVIMLLRLNWLGSVDRSSLFRKHMPDIYVLPNRPSFQGGGKTDSVEYAWFVWPKENRLRGRGKIRVLKPTDGAERGVRSRRSLSAPSS